MDDRKDIEAWADDLLDQHSSAPPRPRPTADETARAVDELPPTLRFLVKRRAGDPDPELIERLGRGARRTPHFENAEAIFTVVGVVLLGAFLLAAYSGF